MSFYVEQIWTAASVKGKQNIRKFLRQVSFRWNNWQFRRQIYPSMSIDIVYDIAHSLSGKIFLFKIVKINLTKCQSKHIFLALSAKIPSDPIRDGCK